MPQFSLPLRFVGSYADAAQPLVKGNARFFDASTVFAGSLLMALSAQVSFQLPFSPVPWTGQTFGVLLVGALLGSRRGAAALMAYLLEGAVGMPVFAGGAAGAMRLFGPTGGYLLGFVPAAFVVGFLAERGWDRRFFTTCLAMIAGLIPIHLFGAVVLAGFVGWAKALPLGLYPFLPGDALKILVAATLLPQGWRLMRALK